MFNLLGGGGLGGLVGPIFSYGFFFILNLIIQIFTGGLSDLFPTDAMPM